MNKNEWNLTLTNVGAVILDIRKERGMTQWELDEAAGIAKSYTAGVETGRYNPSLRTLCKIADALGFSITVSLRKEKDDAQSEVSRGQLQGQGPVGADPAV